MEVPQITAVSPPSLASPAETSVTSVTPNFRELLKDVIVSANQDQEVAGTALQEFADGKADVQAVVLSAVQADLSFSFLVELRNKFTEAYQDLSRMQF